MTETELSQTRVNVHSLMLYLIAFFALLTACTGPADAPAPAVSPVIATGPVTDDPDDPAVWINPTDAVQSLILGTNNVAAPSGALVIYDLAGKQRQVIAGIDRPNNVDVEYGLALGSETVDIAVVTERRQGRLRIFRIPASGVPLEEIGAIPVFESEPGESALPMGIALFKRASDGAVFATVSRKTGPRQGYLWQYRLEDDGSGEVTGTKVREFGTFSGIGEIEAVAVDDELGFVYYADESDGIHKWHADPDHPDAGREVARFGTDGFEGDREGIAIHRGPDGSGYILCTDQVPGDSSYRIYNRQEPHEFVKAVRGGADSTDGIEMVSNNLGPRFPEGLLVAMNSEGKNFLVFDWRDIKP
jgi:3-phytase